MSLPKSWYVRVTEENQKVLSQWRLDTSDPYLVPVGYVVGWALAEEKGHNPNHYDSASPEKLYFGTEISFEDFKEHVLGEKRFILPEKWCVRNPENNESYLLYDYTNSLKAKGVRGMYPYTGGTYFHFPTYDNDCITSTYIQPTYTEITFEQFKKYVMSEKTIIGYILKDDSEEIVKAAARIIKCSQETKKEWQEFKKARGYHIRHYENVKIFRDLGLLDVWFYPVYELDKKVMTLSCEGGSFDVEVSKKGIFYAPEKTWLPVEELQEAIKGVKVAGKYAFTPTHIDSGCKKNVPVKDWEKVINEYNKFKNA